MRRHPTAPGATRGARRHHAARCAPRPAWHRTSAIVRLVTRVALLLSLVVLVACGPSPEPAFPALPYPIAPAPDDAARAEQVACAVPLQKGRMRMEAALAQANVPGVSAAAMVGGRVVWARAWGYADPARTRPMTPETVLQAASVSKPMFGTAVMRMVQQGELSLDEDITEYVDWDPTLNGRRMRVTLRDLLSHSAGTTIHGFGGYDRRKAKLPTTQEIIKKVRLQWAPRTKTDYSGGGFMIAQAAVENEVQAPFSEAMYDWLIRPFGLTHTTFAHPLSPAHLRFAASGLSKGEPVPGGHHLYPEGAAAGMWTTPTDLLTVAGALVRAYQGLPGPISQQTVRTMLTPVMPDAQMALSWHVEQKGDVIEASHGGLNKGFTAQVVWRTDGMGAAVMVNGEGGLAGKVIEAIGEQYGWRPGKPAGCAP